MIEEEEVDRPEDHGRDPRTCASCGSQEVSVRPRWLVFFVIAALLIAISRLTGVTELGWFGVAAAALFALMAGGWRCKECGEAWNA
ncbi:MAG TPA: hypothetical protein VEK11_15570 [Thermoanaerobaculia bacterium]|nr:hypothetical protein [Thermoanaerobaculia bacterium]